MPWKVTNEQTSTFEPVPAGMHLARCYSIIDLGVQASEWGNKPRMMMSWEIPGHTIENSEGQELPMVVSKEYTVSFHEKANLYADMVSWFGTLPEDANGLISFELTDVVGRAAFLNISHRTSQKGKVYANVASVNPVPEALESTLASPIHPQRVFMLEEFDQQVFDDLPEWLQDKVRASLNFTAAAPPRATGSDPTEVWEEPLPEEPPF